MAGSEIIVGRTLWLLALVAGLSIGLLFLSGLLGRDGATLSAGDGPGDEPGDESGPPVHRIAAGELPGDGASGGAEPSSPERAAIAPSVGGVPIFTLAGRVVDGQGRPIRRFGLVVNPRSVYPIPRPTRSQGFNDERGRFAFDGLPAGAWYLRLNAPGYRTLGKELELGPDLTDLELVLADTPILKGTVLDPSGRPIAEATVVTPDGRFANFDDGTFEIQGLRVGRMYVHAIADGFAASPAVEVRLADAEESLEIRLQLTRGASLNVRVIDVRGEPREGLDVRLQNAGGTRLERSKGSTDELGQVLFESLPPDSYVVRAYEGGQSGVTERVASIELADGERRELVLGVAVQNPVRVSGRVLRAGEPPRAGQVFAFPEGPRPMDRSDRVRLDDQGRFELLLEGGLPWVLQVRDGLRQHAFHVEVPRVPTLELELRFPEGSIQGRVLDAAGKPRVVAEVWVRAESGSPVFAPGGPQSVRTGHDGSFAFDGLEAGTYQVSAFGAEALTGIVLEESARVDGLVLVAGETARVVARVRDANGSPVQDARVHARDRHGLWAGARTGDRSGSGGLVTLLLAPGDYTFVARAGDWASSESEPITLAAGNSVDLELTLARAGSLLALLEDASGERVPATFQAFDERGRRQDTPGGPLSELEFVSEGYSSSSHRFPGLTPGPYKVTARSRDGRETSGTAHVEAGATAELRLRLGP